jgi:alpha-tubulin suppressor-like RCC1 family protein
MSSIRLCHTLWTIPVLVGGIIACGDEMGPTQPATLRFAASFAAVSAGSAHTCGLTAAGAAYCWGYNSFGELGDGTTTNYRLTPVLVAGGVSFAAVSAGFNHTCGLTAAGASYCWGANYFGQLGDGGTTQPRWTPVLVAGGVSFAVVSAGTGHTCGLTAAGAAYCWGSNTFGSLGDGTTTGRSTPGLVTGGVSFTAVSAGTGQTCGLTAAGAAYCWGRNFYGQLGDGTKTDRSTPGLVAGGVSFAAVSAGSSHTCGLTSAGATYCWGYNDLGQLGDGTWTTRLTPVLVAGGVSFGAVSAGGGHTCGLTATGAAYCWGYNAFGQLGDGTTTPLFTGRATLAPVAGGVTFAALSAGSDHTCGVTAAHAAYCWGSNAWGKLGDGSPTGQPTPVRVRQ